MGAIKPGWFHRLVARLRFRRSYKMWRRDNDETVAWVCAVFDVTPRQLGAGR